MCLILGSFKNCSNNRQTHIICDVMFKCKWENIGLFRSEENILFAQADVQGYGWRASYVLSALPGFIVGILLATTVKDPFTGYTTAAESR